MYVPSSAVVATLSEDFDSTGRPSFVVTATTTVAVDRDFLAGWAVGLNRRLADRLVRAIESGKVFEDVGEVLTDVYGKTYLRLSMRRFLMGRTLSADLKKIGF